VGADLANVVNEATLLAARRDKPHVEMRDFEEAIDRVIAGLEKKNRVINPQERAIVAVHETGHALVAALTPGADPVHKISIIPRGIGALGHTQQLPTEERYLMTRHELEGKIDVLFGGRAAEQIVFGDLSTGAQNDLQRATEIARAMVLEYGMGDTLGPVTFPRRHPLFLPEHPAYAAEGHREYSEATAQALDLETKKLLEERLEHVVHLLQDKRPLLERIAAVLLEKEVIEGEAFARMVHEDVGDPQPRSWRHGAAPA
jgi:cell division protease FtsH